MSEETAGDAPETTEAEAPATDPRLAEAAAAFARGDFRACRGHLRALRGVTLPASDAALQRQMETALRLDPGIVATGAALLLIWTVLFLRATG